MLLADAGLVHVVCVPAIDRTFLFHRSTGDVPAALWFVGDSLARLAEVTA